MKKITAALLTIVLFLSMLPCISHAAIISITTDPSVFIGGETYNIVWMTDLEGIGYVEYTYDGMLYRVYDEKNGLIRTDDVIHTVRVPKAHLDSAGEYTVYSTYVTSRRGFDVSMSETVSVTRSFRGYSGQDEINAWVVTDTHAIDTSIVKEACMRLPSQSPDILFLLGDIVSSASRKIDTSASNSLSYIFRLASVLTDGSIPVSYTRGNHETRAAYSVYLSEYIGGDEGKFYYDFTYGPISSIVLDFGEDKVDTHHEYTGFAQFQEYHEGQKQWLCALDGYPEADTAIYKLAVCHGDTVKNHFGYDFVSPLTEYGTDLMISGHSHRYTLFVPDGYTPLSKSVDKELATFLFSSTTSSKSAQYLEGANDHVSNFPHLINGCHFGNDTVMFMASQLTFKDGKITTNAACNTKIFDTSFTLQAGLNEEDIIEGPATERSATFYRKPDYYVENDDDIIKNVETPNDPNYAIITKPVVFDTGENYTVVWATSKDTAGTGEVRVHMDGAVYKFADHVDGYSNYISNKLEDFGYVGSFTSEKNIHSAVVPKKYLENGKYECVAQHLMSQGYTTNNELGYEVSTGLIDFDGYDEGEDVKMLVLSECDNVRAFRAVAKTADVIVTAGDVASSIYSGDDLINFLFDLGIITSGKKPVYFTRGENEMTGELATYLMRILKYGSDEFYTKIDFGPVTSVMLDTPAHYGDSFVGYGGITNFENYYKNQLYWLNGQSFEGATYKLAFSNFENLSDCLGTDFESRLRSMGTDLVLTANSETSTFNKDVGFNRASVIPATVLSFANERITVTALDKNANEIESNNFSSKANDKVTYTDVAETAWYADAVNYVSGQSLMVGVGNDSFSPDETVSRAQAAVVLAKLSGADIGKSDIKNTPFTDVDADDYCANAVAWCYENGVTVGTDLNKFSPWQSVTREQLCTLIYNLQKDNFKAASSFAFTDLDSISGYARTPVCTLASAGAVVGMGDGSFAPKSGVSRAQLAQILYRLS